MSCKTACGTWIHHPLVGCHEIRGGRKKVGEMTSDQQRDNEVSARNTLTDLPGLIGVIEVPVMSLPVISTRVYVLEGTRGHILIDAGWDDDTAWQALSDGLAALGREISETEGIVLTHHHPDHSGLAGRVKAESDAWVAMHEIDADLMDQLRSQESAEAHLSWELNNLAAAGAPTPALEAYRQGGGSFSMAYMSAEVDRKLGDGDVITPAAGGLTALWLPGHTGGHMGAILERQRAVFTGDHVLSKTSPHVGEFVFPVDEHDLLNRYLESLEKLRTLAGDGFSIYPAHEVVDIDWPRRIEELAVHHRLRLDDVRQVLSDGEPRTLWDIAVAMTWAVKWADIPPISWPLALSECSAHLTYLVNHGNAKSLGASDQPMKFVAKG
ncbi:MBL fold metallo-hydrolase [Nocardia sp. NPDC004123]